MNKDKHSVLLVLGALLLATASFAACSQPPPTDGSLPSPPPEPEQPEEHPIYISSLAYELKHGVLLGDLVTFLERYPVTREGIHEFSFWAAGSWLLVSRKPAENIDLAKIHIENANSLLTKGKLPTEVASRPLDKNEVATELEEAKSLLEEQRSASLTWTEEDIEWVKQSDDPVVNNEQTIAEIIETYEDYEQRLSRIISTLDRILTELPKAIED